MADEKKDMWSENVKETPKAKEIPEGLFTRPANEIAAELKKIVENSGEPEDKRYPSAMGMLDFYINRAGSNLKPEDRARLEQAKNDLRALFDR